MTTAERYVDARELAAPMGVSTARSSDGRGRDAVRNVGHGAPRRFLPSVATAWARERRYQTGNQPAGRRETRHGHNDIEGDSPSWPINLPSGRWRGRVRDPRTGKQVAPHTVIGGPSLRDQARSRARRRRRPRRARRPARYAARPSCEWWAEWTTDPLWARPAESTNLHNAERTKAFAHAYARPAVARHRRLGGRGVVERWPQQGTVPSLRAMFNDARKPHAGMLIDHNPFAGLGSNNHKGRKHVQPPAPGEVAR